MKIFCCPPEITINVEGNVCGTADFHYKSFLILFETMEIANILFQSLPPKSPKAYTDKKLS